jgi:hypothetical protein
MYDLQDQILSLLAQEESAIEYPKFYPNNYFTISEPFIETVDIPAALCD